MESTKLCFPPLLQGLHNTFDQDMIKVWDDLYDMTDSYTDRWLSSGTLSYDDAAVEQFN